LTLVARAVRVAWPSTEREGLEILLARAGLAGQIDPDELIMGRRLTAIGCALLAVAAVGSSLANDLLIAAVAGWVGYILPISALADAARARQARIRAELASATDILAVAVVGGASLNQAMRLYAERFTGPLADEIRTVQLAIDLGRSRRDALAAFAERCNIEAVHALVSAVLQSEQFGTGLAAILRAQSQQIKTQRRQWVQEQLARAPIKMLLPLGLFVLPSLVIVLLGPAVVQIFEHGLFG
jgi:tight adherence protein C